ncbi:SOS response-associated peptidase [Silvimonas soli]|uniref:SOS response-associated peptidase n=1 Tax=Silvimonas soli TaxID=2980100 RepID=UPI0024B37E2C|nr:SOS response-associated peptidase family protein [Silvimonas soli]
MCTQYDTISERDVLALFGVGFTMPPPNIENTAYSDYWSPIIVNRGDGRQVLFASYGMIPKARQPPGKKYLTLNARAETIGIKPSYKSAWQRCQLCLVPMRCYYEFCYETGKPVRWRIGVIDRKPFAVAGLMRAWRDDNGMESYSFTQITVNADGHAILGRMHEPQDEKRGLVIIRPEDYEAWLTCRDPEIARTFLKLYPAEDMYAEPGPKAPRGQKTDNK